MDDLRQCVGSANNKKTSGWYRDMQLPEKYKENFDVSIEGPSSRGSLWLFLCRVVERSYFASPSHKSFGLSPRQVTSHSAQLFLPCPGTVKSPTIIKILYITSSQSYCDMPIGGCIISMSEFPVASCNFTGYLPMPDVSFALLTTPISWESKSNHKSFCSSSSHRSLI